MAVYLIAAGGTGGHIHPGIAIADKIRSEEKDAVIFFCGTSRGMESRLVPAHGYDFLSIDARGFAGKTPAEVLKAAAAFIRGRAQSRRILRERRPDLVIGTGGYVCGPVLSAAASLGIPTLIHEQNAVPGKANRWLSARARCVCISYPDTARCFAKTAKVVCTGNPVREAFFGLTKAASREALGIGGGEKILYVTGGSLGARSINNAVADLVMKGFAENYRVILSCGSADFPALEEKLAGFGDRIEVHSYIPDQHLYLAAADLVLCRAGAITCSEIAVLGRASVMVPYPYAAGDHQTFNARTFEDVGAAVMVPDRAIGDGTLADRITGLMADPERLERMGAAARSLAYPDAASRIYEQVTAARNVKCR